MLQALESPTTTMKKPAGITGRPGQVAFDLCQQVLR
jgi:hypothetical protein